LKKTNSKPLFIKNRSIKSTSFLIVLVGILLVACTPESTKLQPENEKNLTNPDQNSGDSILILTAAPDTPLAPPLPSPTVTEQPPTDTPSPTATLICDNNLEFLRDITIPDGTQVLRGAIIKKSWLVENNGSCNWGIHHRLRLIEGPSLGAVTEQALYPARSGTQVMIQIVFTAPLEPGRHRSAWGAYSPQGDQFGDIIYIEIVVL
jgi:hypothetical protein